MKPLKQFLVILLILFPFLVRGEDKTVLLAILARDKEHCLPTYLHGIEALDYDKKLITVYINTNNNQDRTEEMLRYWAKMNKDKYRSIIFDSHEVPNLDSRSHQWTPQRFRVLAKIRNESLKMALEEKCDYYFVVDCDNFIIPCTLKALMAKDKPIIAPMLRSIPNYLDHYSNFYCATDAKGYWIDHPDYMRILAQMKVGTFQVPVVHCTYLIQSKYLDQLSYIDGTADYEFVIFSRGAKEKKIGQFICNEQAFGTLVHHLDGSKTLEEEKAILTQFFIMSEPWNRVNNERPDQSS